MATTSPGGIDTAPIPVESRATQKSARKSPARTRTEVRTLGAERISPIHVVIVFTLLSLFGCHFHGRMQDLHQIQNRRSHPGPETEQIIPVHGMDPVVL